MTEFSIIGKSSFTSNRGSFAIASNMTERLTAANTTDDSAAPRREAFGRAIPIPFGLRMPAALATLATDTIDPHVPLLSAIAADTVQPAMVPAGMPSAALASHLAVDGGKVMLLIANQPAAPAAAPVPIVSLIPRMSAPATTAAVPVVMQQALMIHCFLHNSKQHQESLISNSVWPLGH